MNATHRIRILSVDDHPLLREGVKAIIDAEPDMELVGAAVDGQDGIRQFRRLLPDITLMDVRLPDMSGIDALIQLRAEFVNARVIMLSTSQRDIEIRRAMESGARGFLLKTMPPQDLFKAIRAVHEGRAFVPAEVAAELAEYFATNLLTPRELEILNLVAKGMKNKHVADVLSIAEDTVKVHMKHIMEKLGASDRTEAVMIAVRRGMFDA